jgi:glycosyltransferase involved in cell wall biosynthesis
LNRGGARAGAPTPRERSARPVRVVRVIARLNIGGPAQHAILLTAGLDRMRFATTLITGAVGRGEGDFSGMARARGVDPVVIPELGRAIRPGRDLTAFIKLVRLFRALRPDIVHTHTAKAGTLGRLAARLARVPVKIHTFHGHVLDGYFSPPVTRAFLEIERRLAHTTDRLVTVSPRLKVQLLALGIGRPEQVDVVPLGLELDRFRRARPASPTLRPSLGLTDDTPLLGIVGRLVPIKDHSTLFQALARLHDEVRAAHLVVIGDGEERTRLEEFAGRLGLGSRIHFLGWRVDLETILGELDVVICASRNEGTPVALIEAMAAGIPVLSTDVGGVADLVTHGETGWLVPSGDPDGMASAICRLLSDRTLGARLAAAGQAMALDRHDVTRLVPRVEALYADLLAKRQSQ